MWYFLCFAGGVAVGWIACALFVVWSGGDGYPDFD
jgi:hypothetical protein